MGMHTSMKSPTHPFCMECLLDMLGQSLRRFLLKASDSPGCHVIKCARACQITCALPLSFSLHIAEQVNQTA